MRYLTVYSALWAVPERKYRQLLKDVSHGKTWKLDDYGRHIGTVENVTDLHQDMAIYMRSVMRKQRER